MKNGIFKTPGTLPAAPNTIPLYRTAYNQDYFRERAYLRQKEEKLEQFNRIFQVEGRPVQQGSRVSIVNQGFALEVYNTSDSFWYTNRLLANAENIELSKSLPDEKAGAQLAKAQLDKLGLLHDSIRPNGISYTTVAVSRSQREKPQEYKTELHNNFVFELEKLSVFGPGAKIKVSFANREQLSDLYYFWREPHLAGETRVITPERALDLLSRNSRFSQLKEGAAKVHFKSIELGYYAASPDKIQSALVPVYLVKGAVSTEALPRYEFELYVNAAAAAQPERLKNSGMLLSPVQSKVF